MKYCAIEWWGLTSRSFVCWVTSKWIAFPRAFCEGLIWYLCWRRTSDTATRITKQHQVSKGWSSVLGDSIRQYIHTRRPPPILSKEQESSMKSTTTVLPLLKSPWDVYDHYYTNIIARTATPSKRVRYVAHHIVVHPIRIEQWFSVSPNCYGAAWPMRTPPGQVDGGRNTRDYTPSASGTEHLSDLVDIGIARKVPSPNVCVWRCLNSYTVHARTSRRFELICYKILIIRIIEL